MGKLRRRVQKLSGLKHDFNDIYDRPRPDAYIDAMLALRYREPDFLAAAAPEIQAFIEGLPDDGPVRFVDICCGYGLNGAFLRYGAAGTAMLREVVSPRAWALSAATPWGRPIEIIGVDIAGKALAYAEKTGLNDGSIVQNLEAEPITPANAAKISQTDIVVSTGSLSYIGRDTVDRILQAIDPDRPLLTLFWPIIGKDTVAVEVAMKQHGLTVSRSQTPQWQRQFADEAEKSRFLAEYAGQGIATAGTLLEQGVCVAMLTGRRISR